MPAPILRAFRTVASPRYGRSLVGLSRRSLSTSRVCFEDAESERQKGIPLAFELGGVSIENTGKRTSLGQKLAARSGVTLEVTSNARQRTNARDTRKDGPRKPQNRHGDGDQRRVAPRGGEGGPSQGASRKDGRAKFERPSTQGIFAQPRQRPAQSHPAQPRVAGRPQGKRDSAARSPRTAKGKAPRPRSKAAGASTLRRRNLSSNPDLNDYTSEDGKRPARNYDHRGLLILKGRHDQINPVIPPILPKLRTPAIRIPDAKVASTLQVLSYADRAPPQVATQGGHDALDVVDNATRALSRVRDLDMPHRRDALQIVEKMARNGGGADKRPAAGA